MAIAYEVTVGRARFANQGREVTPLLTLEAELAIGGVGSRCFLELGDVSWGEPELGESFSVELDVGEGKTPVFSGEVAEIDQRPDALWVTAHDALAKLACVEVEGAFEEQSVGQIVKQLITDAGAEAGEIHEGPTFPSYVVQRGPRALRHAQKLAALMGAELSTNAEGKVELRQPSVEAAGHTLEWGKDLLAFDLVRHDAPVDSLEIFGEGAAGTEGLERGHWLPRDLDGVTASAAVEPGQRGRPGSAATNSTGLRVRRIRDGAIRSVEVAEQIAEAQATRLALRPMSGHALVFGRPAIQPGHWVELAGLPDGSGAHDSSCTLRVLRVIHRLTNEQGLLTRLEF